MSRLTVLVSALLASSPFLPALAQTASPDAAAVKPVKEKKVCRSEVVTGSLIPAHSCRTLAERRDIEQSAARELEHFNVQRDVHQTSSGR